MKPERIAELLSRVADGSVTADQAFEELKRLPFVDTATARVDTHRELRTGLPEVIFGEGKRPEEIVAIARELRLSGLDVMATRVDDEKAAIVLESLSELSYNPVARVLRSRPEPSRAPRRGPVAVVSAGSSDAAVAEEAVETLEFLKVDVVRVVDVGVAGIHRLLASRDAIDGARVAIVVAGMEGALPSVVGGLVSMPVIAVPTSVGYGASFGGLAALLGMLTSCAAGVTVVNIDNGFGAATAASRITHS
jgi:NCAIR mutase (PurE)-related protein